jgi:hypothetical protein
MEKQGMSYLPKVTTAELYQLVMGLYETQKLMAEALTEMAEHVDNIYTIPELQKIMIDLGFKQ